MLRGFDIFLIDFEIKEPKTEKIFAPEMRRAAIKKGPAFLCLGAINNDFYSYGRIIESIRILIYFSAVIYYEMRVEYSHFGLIFFFSNKELLIQFDGINFQEFGEKAVSGFYDKIIFRSRRLHGIGGNSGIGRLCKGNACENNNNGKQQKIYSHGLNN